MESLIEHLSALSPTAVHGTVATILLLCGLGLPLPEDISLIAAGYMAHLRVVNVHAAFLVCFAAVLAGDMLAFVMGRYHGERLITSGWFKRIMNPRRQRRVQAIIRKYGSKVIFVGRFMPGLRTTIFFSAGVSRLRPLTFLVYDTLAALVSVPALVYAAWAFGEHLDRVVAWAHRSEYGILALIAVGLGVFALATIYRRRRARRRVAPDAAVTET